MTNFIEGIKKSSKDYLGVFLLLDEINGLAEEPEFANFLKGLSDTLNSHASLLFMICGTEEKRQAIIKNHESTNRIFNLYNLSTINENLGFIKSQNKGEYQFKDFFTMAYLSLVSREKNYF